jgi:transcriptional regulator with XRE-family HTH domain
MIKNLHPYWYETYTALEQQGLSQRKIAKEMNVHRTTLQHWLKEQKREERRAESNVSLRDVCKGISTKLEDALPIMRDIIADAALYEVHKEYERKKLREVDSVVAEHNNQRILTISDLHIPYHHRDSLAFLAYLKAKYKPTRIICLGDELDKHALSYHDSDPDLASAGALNVGKGLRLRAGAAPGLRAGNPRRAGAASLAVGFFAARVPTCFLVTAIIVPFGLKTCLFSKCCAQLLFYQLTSNIYGFRHTPLLVHPCKGVLIGCLKLCPLNIRAFSCGYPVVYKT